MELYKIMIVDDEADVREGIMRHVNWEALGLLVVAEAENGQDALDKAEAQEIDIVLTDIKMPFLDGIKMCERLSEQYPALKIIFLTGFDEFEFAKAAISLNAVEYVLKPVNVAEITQVLRRVRVLLDESMAQKRDVEALRANYEKTLPLMRERFLNELIWGITPEEEIPVQLARHGIVLGERARCVVVVFELEPPQERESEVSWELAPLSVKQIVAENLEGRCTYETFLGTSAIIAITSFEKSDPIVELMRLANEICSRGMRVLGLTITAGIGRATAALCDIHHSYADAKSALEYKVVAGTGQAIYIQDIFEGYQDVEAGIVKWPMSVVRISHKEPARLVALAAHILAVWRSYDDCAADIVAYTGAEPHNTITPIARRRGDAYELDLVLRNNRTTQAHPLGLFHPYESLHNIKKENIGLIEAMGLAVLPSRLLREMEALEEALLEKKDLRAHALTRPHADWAERWRPAYKTLTHDTVGDVLRLEVGKAFIEVLEHAGVFKRTPAGKVAFERFLAHAGGNV